MAARSQPNTKEDAQVKSFPKGTSLMDFGIDGNISLVEVKNGKILRIKPFHYEWQYDRQKFNPWRMEVRGKVFQPAMKTLLPPFGHALQPGACDLALGPGPRRVVRSANPGSVWSA